MQGQPLRRNIWDPMSDVKACSKKKVLEALKTDLAGDKTMDRVNLRIRFACQGLHDNLYRSDNA
jgi:serine protease inhibitor ecotin